MRTKTELSNTLGKYKMYINRLQAYLSIVNFVMLLYLYITESPMGIVWYWWIIGMSTIFPIILYFDVKLVYPGTLVYAYKKNPGFQRLEKKVDKILDYLEKENEKTENAG